MKFFWLLAISVAVLTARAEAHPLAPALLDLREVDSPSNVRYDALWRTSIARVRGADVQPRLPADCHAAGAAQMSAEENQSLVRRWTLVCTEPLQGRTIRVDGLDGSGINVIVRLQGLRGKPATVLLGAEQPEARLPVATAPPPVFRGYFALGVEHLLLGFDHALLVLGLVLLVRRLRALVFAVTAFTLGHSATLALATLGIVALDQRVTEFAIALSILYLAVEILRPAAPPTPMRRRPWLMAALFGLLHGLGFAGALAEIGLPQGEIPLALLAFNLGIEAGQLLLIGMLLCAMSLWARAGVGTYRAGATLSRAAALAPVYLIGSLAAFWCFERAALMIA